MTYMPSSQYAPSTWNELVVFRQWVISPRSKGDRPTIGGGGGGGPSALLSSERESPSRALPLSDLLGKGSRKKAFGSSHALLQVAIGSMAVKNEGKATPKSEGEASPSGSSCLRKEQVFYETARRAEENPKLSARKFHQRGRAREDSLSTACLVEAISIMHWSLDTTTWCMVACMHIHV